jgi:GNAT superfamily N-acetyltransferase
MTDTLKIIRIKGGELKPYIADLAALRITVFRAFPYLYDGEMENEKKYLQIYIDSPNATMILVLDGQRVVGASTAIPLRDETDECKAPFLAANMNIDTIFYFGESVLLPEYRGQQIGKQFFAEREAAARENHCTIAAFCGVERPVNHPRRPADWHALDNFWQKLGYKKHPEIHTTYSWKDLDDDHSTEKPMIFWMKTL